MWSDGPFARPVSSFEAPVPPVNVDPAQGPFFYVAVNQAWMPYVIGSLFQLLLQTTWDTPEPDTLSLAQEQAFNLLNQFQIATNICPSGSGPMAIAEMGYDMSICEQLRFQDGKLQGYCCGEWVDIAGQGNGEGLGAPGQPGEGQPQPTPGGGCETYHAVMQGNSGWNLPTGVNTGDVITVMNPTGATYDGGYSPWNCWDGNSFFLGLCIPGTGGPVGGDPASGVKHMHLVCKIGSVWYNTDSPITVPAGIVNAPVNFQVNDSVLTDNGGSLAYDVQVCNNTPAGWRRRFDFTLSSWDAVRGGATVPGGHWSAGAGLLTDDGGPDGFGTYYRTISMLCDFGVTTEIKTAAMTLNYTQGSVRGLDSSAQFLYSGVALIQHDSSHSVNGTPAILTWSGDQPGVTQFEMQIRPSNAASLGALNGSAAVLIVEFTGVGTPPTNGVAF